MSTVEDIQKLPSYDYAHQNNLIRLLFPSLPPLPSRFSVRAMTPEDIPAVAHHMAHCFGTEGLFAIALSLPWEQGVKNWMRRLELLLCDHLIFLIQDNEFDEADRYSCNCSKYIDANVNLFEPPNIVSCAVSHDLCTNFQSVAIPPTLYKQYSVWEFLQLLEHKRQKRIREEDNIIKAREEKEKDKKDAASRREEKLKKWLTNNTQKSIAANSSSNESNSTCTSTTTAATSTSTTTTNNATSSTADNTRDPLKDSFRTKPLPGEGVELWLLATRKSHARHHLATYLSLLTREYVAIYTSYLFLTLQAAHIGTEKIWTSKEVGGRVMSRAKTREFEFSDEKGEIIRPFAGVTYDMCSIDVDLAKYREKRS